MASTPLAQPWRDFVAEFGETPRLIGSLDETKDQLVKLVEKLKSKYEFPQAEEGVNVEDWTLRTGIPVRVYTSSDGYDNLTPVVVYFHGGGFVVGSIEEDDPFCRSLARATKTIVLSIGYGLAPFSPFPDTIDASMDILDLAGKFSSRPISFMGVGAGANLAMALALKAHADGSGDRVAGVVALSPLVMHPNAIPADEKAIWTSLDANDGKSINSKSAILSWLAAYAAPATDPLMSVMLHDKLHELKRVYIQGYTADTLYDDARFLAEALHELGVMVEKDFFEGYPHLAYMYPSKHLDAHREDFKNKVFDGVKLVAFGVIDS